MAFRSESVHLTRLGSPLRDRTSAFLIVGFMAAVDQGAAIVEAIGLAPMTESTYDGLDEDGPDKDESAPDEEAEGDKPNSPKAIADQPHNKDNDEA